MVAAGKSAHIKALLKLKSNKYWPGGAGLRWLTGAFTPPVVDAVSSLVKTAPPLCTNNAD